MFTSSTNCYCLVFLVLIIDIISAQIVRCDNGQCNCPDVTTVSSTALCILDCHTAGICNGQTLNCRDNDKCHIICDGDGSCSNATINGNTATDITVICSTPNSCSHYMDIKCGTDRCILQCDVEDACSDLGYIELSMTSSFECIGYCPYAFPSVSSHASSQTVISPNTTNHQTMTPASIYAPAMYRFNTVVTIIVVLICMLSIIILTTYGCCFCYIRMNNKLRKQMALQNATQMHCKSLSPIAKEIPQTSVFIAPLNDDNNYTDDLSETKTISRVRETDDVAPWIYENISSFILSPSQKMETEDKVKVKASLFPVELTPIGCCSNESSESRSLSDTNNTRITHSYKHDNDDSSSDYAEIMNSNDKITLCSF